MENNKHNKKAKKLFDPLRFLILLIVFIAISLTTVFLSIDTVASDNGGVTHDDNGETIFPGWTMRIRGVSANGEVCRFENTSPSLTYFIPTKFQFEWDAVKSTASTGTHDLKLVQYGLLPACGFDCDLPWGGTILHGESVSAYNPSTVECGSCPSVLRYCNNGILSGSGSNVCQQGICGSGFSCQGNVCVPGDCTPYTCGDYEGLASLPENNGRNCGPNLFNGCDWINCGCNSDDVCTIEPENLGFPDELAMISGELKGYCRTDTGCNPVVYPSTHSEFGRIYCFADIISQGEGEPYESVISQICFDTRAKGAHSRVYHIEPHSLCWVGQHNGHTCSSYFQLPAGNDYLIVFFDETQQFIGGSNGYFVNPPADKNIQLCSQTYDESMDPPSGTCVGDSWLNCDQHEFEWECESAEGCEWEFDEDDDGPGAIRNGDGR